MCVRAGNLSFDNHCLVPGPGATLHFYLFSSIFIYTLNSNPLSATVQHLLAFTPDSVSLLPFQGSPAFELDLGYCEVCRCPYVVLELQHLHVLRYF